MASDAGISFMQTPHETLPPASGRDPDGGVGSLSPAMKTSIRFAFGKLTRTQPLLSTRLGVLPLAAGRNRPRSDRWISRTAAGAALIDPPDRDLHARGHQGEDLRRGATGDSGDSTNWRARRKRSTA
jgi:hypothetical protein